MSNMLNISIGSDITKVVAPTISCNCMDNQTATDIKLALISSRERFKGMSRLMEREGRIKEANSFENRAERIDQVIERIEKMKPC